MKLWSSHILCLCTVLFMATGLQAQDGRLVGTVLDASTSDVLPGANVFIDGTLIGDQSDAAGRFVLEGIPDGNHTLVVSFVGYHPVSMELNYPPSDPKTLQVALRPEVEQMARLTVTAEHPREWKRNLRYFQEHFLGPSRNARQTEIRNPEVLDFAREDGIFVATAQEPLVIENRALGYRIRYFLDRFQLEEQTIQTKGYYRFLEMEDPTDSRRSEWRKERRRAYNGSYRHFLHALVEGTLRESGFYVYFASNLTYTLNFQNQLVQGERTIPVENPNGLYEMMDSSVVELSLYKNFTFLRVDYHREDPEPAIVRRAGFDDSFPQISFVRFPAGRAIIDLRTGTEIDPYQSVLHGYWGWSSRVPDLLPRGYTPAHLSQDGN